MAFQTSIQKFLVKSELDENMNLLSESFPSPPQSPEYQNSFTEIKKELEESIKKRNNEKENIPLDFNANLKSCKATPIYKPGGKVRLKKNNSSKLSQVVLHPNYSRRGRTGITEQVKRDFNFKRSGYATHCFVCENRVKAINLRCHLYFGYVKCEDCGKVITSCLKFGNLNIPDCKDNGQCPHSKLDWVFPPVDNLKRLLDEDEETFDESLIQYLKSLKGLGKIDPFKDAIAYCKMYLKEKEYSRTITKFSELNETSTVTADNTFTLNISFPTASASSINKITSKIKTSKACSGLKEKYTVNVLPVTINNTFAPIITLPTASASSLSKITSRIKNQNTSSTLKETYIDDVLPIFPENGFYIIVKKVIEECPNCYEPLNPQDLKINTNNWLISTSCKVCSLAVYFLLDPPDGSEGKLKIILT